MNSQQWNEKFFEHRMSYLDSQPTPSPHVGEIWRTVPGSGCTEQVSDCGSFRATTRERVMAGQPGITETRADPALVSRVFPLNKERLFV
jgi:hypothetical protein